MKDMTRRIVLRAFASTPAIASLGRAQSDRAENADSTRGHAEANAPKVFDRHQYATLCSLCEKIIPPDETSGGALQAGAPELIDLLASENEDYRVRLTGGLQWLDSACQERYGRNFLDCSQDQVHEILTLIAYRENAEGSPKLSSGIAFFTFVRDLTLGGYFTSEIGMKSLPYLGNQFVKTFPGCPPIPES